MPANLTALFREALALQDQYEDCAFHNRCRAKVKRIDRGHCPECLRYLNASVELQAGLGLQPWNTNPLDVDYDEPPAWVGADDWQRAVELRRQLENDDET